MGRVLVVDDDVTVREVVVSYLRAHGHQVEECGDGDEALGRLLDAHGDAAAPDLVVLDLMLPGTDGLEVCRRLRSAPGAAAGTAVVMLTALTEAEDRIAGLEVGADDYVTKPFSARELALRVDSVLRRAGVEREAEEPPVRRDGDLVLDTVRHEVTRAGAVLGLTAREFDLLAFLLAHPGRVWSREELLSRVWGWTVGDLSTVTVHVRRLREKVEPDPGSPSRLVTVWGVGYRWEPSGGA